MQRNAHHGVGIAVDAIELAGAPYSHALSMEGGQVAAVRRPLHVGLRPELALVDLQATRMSLLLSSALDAALPAAVACNGTGQLALSQL